MYIFLYDIIYQSLLNLLWWKSNKSNLLQYENSQEIYSLGLGLVYKEEIVTQINNGDQNDILQGSEYVQELIEYWIILYLEKILFPYL